MSILKEKSFAFAVRTVRASQFSQINQREYVLSKQLLRSGTAVGAMIREAEYAETKPDFIHKLAIAQKGANEILYWLELLETTSYFSNSQASSLKIDAIELLKLLTSSLKTAKTNTAVKY